MIDRRPKEPGSLVVESSNEIIHYNFFLKITNNITDTLKDPQEECLNSYSLNNVRLNKPTCLPAE